MTLPVRTPDDFVKELAAYLPVNWFSPAAVHPGGNMYALLKGAGTENLVPYTMLATVERQLTLTNAVGQEVDDIAHQYFDDALPRLVGESDSAYKIRIVARLFLQVGTRGGMSDGITGAVGAIPQILELPEAQLTGGWASWESLPGGAVGVNTGGWLNGSDAAGPLEFDGPGPGGGAWDGSDVGVVSATVYGPLAWDTGGRWYAHLGPYQALITVQQPEPTSGMFLSWYQIMALIDSLKPVGTIMWVKILGPAATSGVPIF